MLENVTYDYYTSIMGRSLVPDLATFNSLALQNKAEYKKLYEVGIVTTSDEEADKAVCMMIETQYIDETLAKEGAKASESIDGYSYSVGEDTKLAQEKNFKTTDQKKWYWIKLFCEVRLGVI